jgi:hypothetical protein
MAKVSSELVSQLKEFVECGAEARCLKAEEH